MLSLSESSLAAADSKSLVPYFHDFTVDSASVQADVVNGGLKTDLSVLFDATTLPSDYNSPYAVPTVSTNSRSATRTAGVDNLLQQQ